ncbi:MAG: hypothetical protein IKG82_10710 [Oscillospiraceae bacterium]|nr:hypothetical protein [Oscillospiraceae bacterium]
MNRMAVPTMDVVRFKENDVIVASGPIDGILLAGFNNSTAEDATVNGYHIVDYVNIYKLINSHTEVYFRYNGNAAVSAEDLLDHEETGSLCDGIYTRSDENTHVMWTWQSQ